MTGKSVGDTFEAEVPPEEGYGTRQGPGPQPLPRDAFPADAQLFVGMNFQVEAESGDVMTVWITSLDEDVVYIDANHPMAGQTLYFSIEVMEIREADEEEISQGHPHPPGGVQD